MFVKIYRDSEMLAIQPLTFEKRKDSVVIASLEEIITFKNDGQIGRYSSQFDYGYEYLMCNGECYNATPEGYQEFFKEVVNKL